LTDVTYTLNHGDEDLSINMALDINIKTIISYHVS